MSKVRESFSQQLNEFEAIVVEKIKEHSHDVFINETLQAIGEVLPKTRGTPAREDTRFGAHRIVHQMILQFSQDDQGIFTGSFAFVLRVADGSLLDRLQLH